jgi:hypothetical protein
MLHRHLNRAVLACNICRVFINRTGARRYKFQASLHFVVFRAKLCHSPGYLGKCWRSIGGSSEKTRIRFGRCVHRQKSSLPKFGSWPTFRRDDRRRQGFGDVQDFENRKLGVYRRPPSPYPRDAPIFFMLAFRWIFVVSLALAAPSQPLEKPRKRIQKVKRAPIVGAMLLL